MEPDANLCEVCRDIDYDALNGSFHFHPLLGLTEPPGYQHHRNYGKLEASAYKGCPLCKLLQQSVDQSLLYPNAQLILLLKKHNPNCADKYGAPEMELYQRAGNPYGNKLATLGIYVEPGQ
jgi:hypothetical protein